MALWVVEHQAPTTRAPTAPPPRGTQAKREINLANATGQDATRLFNHYAAQQAKQTGEDPAEVAEKWRRFHELIRG